MQDLTLADMVRFIVIAMVVTFIGAPMLMLSVRWWLSILQLANYGLV